MTGIAGILHHVTGTLNPLAKANPMSSTQSASGSSADDGSTVSANDFLTLLVTEMKNQDPTQPMDPSQMVSQLATVSEVGQSVQANSTLASLLTATSLSD